VELARGMVRGAHHGHAVIIHVSRGSRASQLIAFLAHALDGSSLSPTGGGAPEPDETARATPAPSSSVHLPRSSRTLAAGATPRRP
jgi:hypothetical protein